MIKVEITDGNTTFLLSPHSIEIPDVRNMNESLQHEEQTCKMTAVFDVDLLSLLMNHADLQACVSDGETSLFTGFVDNNTDFTDNGEPEPADIINITIRDRTRLFDITTESEVAQIGKTLSQIVSVICQNCNVTNAAVFSDNPQVAAFVLDKDKKYLDALNTLLFQYGYTWFFNEDGEFEVLKINLQNVTESITDSDLFTSLNISKTRKNYNAIKVTYGTLTKKGNEQVFFTGNGLGGDNKVVPFTIRPGQYYPYESDPVQEQREGKVFQNFESGYAEEYTTYSGEKKFRRATNQTLIYTENHNVVEDWEGSIVINRTEYGARSAAVRLLNTGTKDAELKQFAIRADAYYRSSNNSVTVGSGKKEYSYEAEHIYDDTAASNLATLLSKLYTDTCIKFSGKIRRNIKPGTICSIATGLSGITCNALVINSQYDPENDLHTITLNSISEVQMNSSRYKERKSENSLTENLALLDEAISDLKDGTADVGNPDPVEGLTAVANQNEIVINWDPLGNGLKNTIKRYYVEIKKGNNDWQSFTFTTANTARYVFDRTSDGYPEYTAFNNWKFRVKAENIYDKLSASWAETLQIDTTHYGTWLIPQSITVQKEVIDRTIILTALYEQPTRNGNPIELYGTVKTKLWVSRKGNTDEVNGTTFNQFLGIMPDTDNDTDLWYTPEFTQSAMPSDTQNTENNYCTWENGAKKTDAYISNTYKITHTLPLIGQTKRLFDKNNVFIGKFNFEATDVSEEPQSPSVGDVIHFTGITGGGFEQGKYYRYEEKTVEGVTIYEWAELISKMVLVPTEYKYKVQMYVEEGGSASNEVELTAQALCTNISDFVHSHEHYKDLYVEKLSAINANIGLISQGGIGSFADQLNYWALSDMSAEDSGYAGGVKKGAFRVGGSNEYFKVTPLGNDEYKIELKAGNIELTSSTGGRSGMNFLKGTFVYSSDKLQRLALTPEGILIQQYIGVTPSNPNPIDYATTSQVTVNKNNDLIISNSDETPEFGYQISGSDVYHFDGTATDEESQNPQSISVSQDSTFLNNDSIKIEKEGRTISPQPLLNTGGKKSIEGTVSKDISQYTGKIGFATLSSEILFGTKALKLDGTFEDIPAPLTGYNQAMREQSTVSGFSGTVGAYLGLSDTQVSKGIFN